MRAHHLVLVLGLLASACSDPLAPSGGAVRISLSVMGMDGDPDGYLVSVDGRHRTMLTGPGATTLAVGSGRHTVILAGLADNCTPDGADSQRVDVSPADTAEVDFAVTCLAVTGVVEVGATSTGSDPDIDGYLVSLDGGAPRTVFGHGVVRYAGVAGGTHTVNLSGAAPNCTIAPPNPNTGVTVQVGGLVRDTAHVVFQVSCAAITGALRIITSTTGNTPDPDGYLVTVTPGMTAARRFFPNDTLVAWGFTPGRVVVGLGDIAPNCASTSAPQVAATVVVGDTSDVILPVVCVGPGTVRVTTSTTGAALDPSFTLTLDGAALNPIPSSGTVSVTVPTGTHSIGLADVALNCTLSGANPVGVTVAEGATTDVTFDVACVSPGTVRVTAPTSGSDLDPSYLVTVDGGSPIPLLADGTLSLDLAPGSRLIALTDVAANCTVAGSNPVTVTVPQGGTVDITFTVTCAPIGRTGADFVFSTTGSNLDTSYYLTLCTGYCYYYYAWEGPVPANGAVPIDLPSGTYDYYLSDVAGNCSTTTVGSVTVVTGQVATVNVTVSCTPAAGLNITVATTGSNSYGGYSVQVDGTFYWLPISGVLALLESAGSHTVQLSNLPPNCAVAGSSSVVVDLVVGTTTDVGFNVTCTQPAMLRVTASSSGTDQDSYYLVQVDGTGTQWLGLGQVVSIPVGGGTHSVQLTDVAANCTVTSQTPVLVTVPAGGTADVSFTLDCIPNPTLRATVTTTGANQPAGYFVGLDPDYYYGYQFYLPVAANGIATIRVPVGSHTVTLDQVPLNCTVTSPNNLSVNLVLGSTTDVAFTVSCQ